MVEQGALRGQESARDFKALGMPVLAFEFLLFLKRRDTVCLGLHDEAHLGRNTEVGNHSEGYFKEERVTGELNFIPSVGQALRHCYGLQLHDVANIQIIDPLVLVQVAEH